MTCLFGGTFDPVHLGHTHAAACVCDALSLRRIALVLSAHPSHRAPTGASLAHRWAMLQLACAADPRLAADDREARRPGPSYTVETLRLARAEVGAEPLLWVIGNDALLELPSWYRWREVLELCSLVVLARPGVDRAYPRAVAELVARRATAGRPAKACGEIYFVEARMRDISASAVRAALGRGGAVEHLLDPQVAAYISRHGLYGARRER